MKLEDAGWANYPGVKCPNRDKHKEGAVYFEEDEPMYFCFLGHAHKREEFDE